MVRANLFDFALADRDEEHARSTHHALYRRRWIVAPDKRGIQFAFCKGVHDVAFRHSSFIN